MRQSSSRKDLGSYYTPADVVRTLVTWAMEGDLSGGVLDPSCGDGRFLRGLKDAVGVDVDPVASAAAAERVEARIVTADFFAWASETNHRFAATVGNPPFIRYQRFNGALRQRALEYCAAQGVTLSGLCSSWAPFVVAASSVLKPGGRLAFVVPAEIGHAVYARKVRPDSVGATMRFTSSGSIPFALTKTHGRSNRFRLMNSIAGVSGCALF